MCRLTLPRETSLSSCQGSVFNQFITSRIVVIMLPCHFSSNHFRSIVPFCCVVKAWPLAPKSSRRRIKSRKCFLTNENFSLAPDVSMAVLGLSRNEKLAYALALAEVQLFVSLMFCRRKRVRMFLSMANVNEMKSRGVEMKKTVRRKFASQI